ncbi:MAG: class I SAM-dependent methyltransferase [Pleurocapsa minor GSE-CHR-MK-17-07R]|jgi:SAM-dependent methyltransferase|nr:class I SAM-dependent methyltransferase [Pleurocapsa minor GSE-CHR-MK 17-07R]
MSVQDRKRWDERYKAAARVALPAPDPLLFQFTPPVTSMRGEQRALDLACGIGQNGLWLAGQGYSVDLLDISREALRRAQSEAHALGLRRVNFLQVDLDEAALATEAYDLVCVFRYFQRDLLPRIRECVSPGGRVIYQTYTVAALRELPELNPRYLAEQGELAGAFADWDILRSDESELFDQVVALKPDNRGDGDGFGGF